MSRRNITVAGIAYRWQLTRDGNSVVVFPPAGGGSPHVIPRPEEEYPDICIDDTRVPVTPGLVAELIHVHVLKRRPPPAPPRAPARAAPRRREATLPTWTTSPETPRTYVVTGTVAAEGLPPLSFVVEAHRDPATAGRAARALDGLGRSLREHFQALANWHAKGRDRTRPTYRRGYHPGSPGCPAALDDWFLKAVEAGARSLDALAFRVAEIPFRVPAEPVPHDWQAHARAEREALLSLSRTSIPA